MKIIIFIFYFSLFSTVQNIAAQQSSNLKKQKDNIQCELTVQNTYKEWKKININGISICLPKELKSKKIQGIDLSFDEYKNDDTRVHIYTSRQAPIPTIEQTYKTFRDELKYVNNIWTWIWFYETEEKDIEYKFIRGVQYFVKNKIDGDVVTIYIKTKNDNLNQVTDKIIASVNLIQ